MKTYQVGGAVRDELLGLPVKDRDYVVVGSTPEEMARLGYKPVGKDFPVFLHPQTHAEYALARTERKTARGYHGFQVYAEPDVTLEQDLSRRDLTINAIAKDENGQLTDPYGGEGDLRDKVLRHVSAAFTEDPVRVLRVARFAARFKDFTVAPETMTLMRAMAASGEVDSLVAERVWQEFAKGLKETTPSRMFATLIKADALYRIVPEFSHLAPGDRALQKLDRAAANKATLAVRYATLVASIDAPDALPRADLQASSIEIVAKRLRVPSDCADLAKLAQRHSRAIANARKLASEPLLALLLNADSLRRPTRFFDLLAVSQYLADGDIAVEVGYLRRAHAALGAMDSQAIVRSVTTAADIPAQIRAAQLNALQRFIAAPG